MRIAHWLAIGLIALGPYAAIAQQRTPDRCAEALRATSYLACAEAPHGIALADTAERADSLATFAQAGEERFALTFGLEPTPYAVAELREQDSLREDEAALKALGYGSVLPWISHSHFAATLKATFERAAEAQALSQGLTPEAQEQLARTMLEAEAHRLTKFKMEESDAGTVPHELGHMWFAETYWPNRPPAEGRYYGTPAPDWLDEMAAVLTEGQELADGRRRTFVDVYHGRGKGAFAGHPVSELIDLQLFLTRTHPGFGMHAAEHAEQRRTGRTMVVIKTGPDAAAAARVAGLFYSTARLVADYLTDRSGGMNVFPSISTALSQGDSFERWLAREGPRHRLPATMEALETDWHSWLEARFGTPGSAFKTTA